MATAKKRIAKLFDWSRTSAKKDIFQFSEGTENDTHLFGNKGAMLCGMVRLGLPVPPGFLISTSACMEYLKKGSIEASMMSELRTSVKELERQSGRSFVSSTECTERAFPLFLSVRSGAPVSMPGMMSTILNVGMNDSKIDQLARVTNNRRFALDVQRRFLQMFGEVVLGVDKNDYEQIIQEVKDRSNLIDDALLRLEDLAEIVDRFKRIVTVPDDPWIQLEMSIEAVFKSWNTPRARKYRDLNNISEDLGTGVIVQSMVFGNMNVNSGTGVVFTRNPSTGEKEFYGEYLAMAEGEDVVSGSRTPVKLEFLQLKQPTVYDTLVHSLTQLEAHYKDAQDVEFTVENGVLHILQTRNAKRSAQAAVKIAVAMVQERLLTEREAILRLDPKHMDAFLHPMVDPLFRDEYSGVVRSILVGKGLCASAGAAKGQAVFECEDAERLANEGKSCILIREYTSADDIAGLKAATGVVTLRGGLTSHAAVVMRGMGKSAVTSLQHCSIDHNKKTLSFSHGKRTISEGDEITIDGSTGLVYSGEVPMIPSSASEEFRTILSWADKYKRMGVLANSDTPDDAAKALEFGAEGIGLCRTEHMFFNEDRLMLFRQLIMAETREDRLVILNRIAPIQTRDFEKIFRTMVGQQITIRLLDPPLHEFIPDPAEAGFEDKLQEFANHVGMSLEQCKRRISSLQEVNPMLGLRGCRLSIVNPEITEMQIGSMIDAAILAEKDGVRVGLQVMIPLVFSEHEVDYIVGIFKRMKTNICNREGVQETSIFVQLGAMVETPRSCLRADRIAAIEEIDFLSIGSNDLTQMVLGLSRDDSQQFMGEYIKKHIVAFDPFESLDTQGVGSLVDLAVRKARRANPSIKIGVCGEHGADPASIKFFDAIGLDYISCSPFQVPGAKVSAAQAHISDTIGGAMKRNISQLARATFGLV